MKIVAQSTELVEVRSLCDYPLYFKLMVESGDAKIEPYAGYPDYLPLEEIKAQIRARNTFFIGTDGRGNHACIAIMDDDVRRELFYIRDDEMTELLTLDAVKDLLAISNQDDFAQRLRELVVTNAERRMIGKLAEEAGVDDLAAWKGRLIKKVSNWMPDIFPNFNDGHKPVGCYS